MRVGFKSAGANMSGFNAAMAYTLQHAVKGVYPALGIDYTKVLVCTGNLPGAMNPVAASMEAGKIDFTWNDNSWDFGAKTTDKVVLAAYCPLIGKSVSIIGNTTRALGTQNLTLPDIFAGQQVHAYIGFCTAEKSEFCKGEFVDTLVVV